MMNVKLRATAFLFTYVATSFLWILILSEFNLIMFAIMILGIAYILKEWEGFAYWFNERSFSTRVIIMSLILFYPFTFTIMKLFALLGFSSFWSFISTLAVLVIFGEKVITKVGLDLIYKPD